MEEAGLVIFTAASHQMEIERLHFLRAVMASIFMVLMPVLSLTYYVFYLFMCLLHKVVLQLLQHISPKGQSSIFDLI